MRSALVSLALALPALAQDPRLLELRGMIPHDSQPTRAVLAEDFDGDGHADLFLVGSGGDQLLFNDGWGVFERRPGSLPLAASEYAAAGDVDGDGDMDLLVSNPPFGSSSAEVLLLNDGSGVFADASATHLPAFTARGGVALFDADGDLDLDAAVGDVLLLNDGSGVFALAPAGLPVPALVGPVLAFDRDMDGALDLFHGANDDQLSANDGAGAFSDADADLPLADRTTSAAAGDTDGDGDVDVVRVSSYASALCLLNDGAGVFSAGSALSALPGDSGIALADVDGDLDLDLLMTDRWSAGTTVDAGNALFLNDGGGAFTASSTALPYDDVLDTALALVDIDQDGDADLVVGSWQSRLYLNDGAGAFGSGQAPVPDDRCQVELSGTYDVERTAVALGDVDGDGDVDAVVTNAKMYTDAVMYHGPVPHHLYLNDGAGAFSPSPAPLAIQFGEPQDVALLDIEADGDLDLLFASADDDDGTGSGAHLQVNDGAGLFTDGDGAVSWSSFLRGTCVAAGDLDGDGDPDAVLGNGFFNLPETFRAVVLQNSAGTFAQLGSAPFLSDRSADVALGDVDEDGDLDALFAAPLGDTDLVLNDGAGAFSDASGALLGSAGAYAAALGDLDGDGHLDAYLGGFGGDQLLLGDGAGGFADASATLPPSAGITYSVALADLDGDLDLDAVLGAAGPNRVLEGTPGGLVERPDLIQPDGDVTFGIALADLDGDDDPDAFVVGSRNRVYQNAQRQLARRGDLRIDKALRLELYGAAGAPWVLLGAVGLAPTDIPPFGTFHLDPATTLVIGSGLLDGAGEAVRQPFVPDDPSLAGLSVWFQAVIDLPLGFSNLESGTVTAF